MCIHVVHVFGFTLSNYHVGKDLVEALVSCHCRKSVPNDFVMSVFVVATVWAFQTLSILPQTSSPITLYPVLPHPWCSLSLSHTPLNYFPIPKPLFPSLASHHTFFQLR